MENVVVVVALRADGRVVVLSDTEEVIVILDHPDDEGLAPCIYEAEWNPTFVANRHQEALEDD